VLRRAKGGKSFFITRLLYGAALGLNFGKISCPRPLRALYVAAEGESGFASRIVALRERFGDAHDAFQYVAQRVTVGPPSDHLADLIEAARQMRADVIAPDTVARTCGAGDENATKDMGAYVAALDRLRAEAATAGGAWPAVVVVHHGPKTGEGARGSIALPAAADVIVKVERRDGGNIAVVEAAKDAEAGATIRFRLRPAELGEDQDGEPRRTCVAEPDEAADRDRTHGKPCCRCATCGPRFGRCRSDLCRMNRTRFLGHSVGLRGHGHGRKLVLAASCVWAEVAVFLDQPLGVVAGDEGSDGVAEVFEGLEDAAVDELLLECAEEPLDDAVGLGSGPIMCS
jgi:hypothetical protein